MSRRAVSSETEKMGGADSARMKNALLWALLLSVGCAALFFGIARPEVSTTSKKLQQFVEQDPATRPAIRLPPLIVSEPRLPAIAPEPGNAATPGAETP